MYIYKTTNLINNMIYVGQCVKSIECSQTYFGSGKMIKLAIKEYGIQHFKKEIIEICKNNEDLNKAEIFWIKYFNSRNPDIGYNITKGGTISEMGNRIKAALNTPEAKKIASDKNKKMWQNSEYRKKVTESNKLTWNSEKKDEHSRILKEKWANQDKRKKLSDSLKNMEKITCPHCGVNGALNIIRGKHFDNCVKHTDPIKREIAIERLNAINRNTKKIECPHCGKSGSVGNINRWHFNNCKFKNK